MPLDEAKMLVLGDEAVGKTSLVRFLIQDLPRDQDEKATRGARLHERITTEGWTPEEAECGSMSGISADRKSSAAPIASS